MIGKRGDCTHRSSDGVYTLQRKPHIFLKATFSFFYATLSSVDVFTLCYLTSWAFLHGTNNSLPGQANQDVGAIVVQGHVVPIKCDHAQI